MLGETEKLSACPTFVDLQQFLSKLFQKKKKSAKLSEGLLLLCGVQVVFPVCEHAGAKSCFGG